VKRSPLKRKTPLKPKRTKPRRVSVARDDAYKQALRELGYCCVAESMPNAGPCWGRIECMHLGKRNGMSSKGSDHSVAPGCSGHHRMQEDYSGPFKGHDLAWMLEWGAQQVAIAAARLRIGKWMERMAA
jgi:hypothetical protein